MALKSGLSLICYTSPTSTAQALVMREYSREVEQLRFTTVNPGGYGTLTALLRIKDARLPHPEFSLFSRVVVMGHGENGPYAVWIGEMTDPRIGLRNGEEYVQISALGLGSSLRDDTFTQAYSSHSVQFMARDILAQKNFINGTSAKTLRVDSDNSMLFPDTPSGLYSPTWNNNTAEEMFAALVALAGNGTNAYTWWVAAHPLGQQPNAAGVAHQDAAGMPNVQVNCVLVDTATMSYQASVQLKEIVEYWIGPSADRAYNAVGVDANNGNNGVQQEFVTDSRLNSDKSQGSAPFPFRKLMRDYSGTPTITTSVATTLANGYLNEYKNVTNKNYIVLKAVRNGQGNEIPLWAVNAHNTNIFIPEMAVRSIAALPTTPTAGVNLFYLVSSEYSEMSETDAQLTIQTDNWNDKVADQVARLTLAADALLRSNKTAQSVQKPGNQITSQCGVSFVATAGGQKFGVSVGFPAQAPSVPSGITLSTLQNNNASGTTISQITAYGFHLTVTSVAAGQVDYVATYTTQGL